ncbi:MAG: hemerythrin domain-containing protein [Gammaproteobacteria bacterium]|nr:MAG: hemerythrin domain-containing protein [Gammaproteobacteria bacterium]
MNWLNHDHREIESAVYRCRSACDIADWSLVQDVFAEMASDYKNHIRIEENVLFPAYEAHPEASSGPTESLQADHEQIVHLMDHIAQRLADNNRKSLAESFSLLYRILRNHHEKEEEIFLPMASGALYSNKDAILAKMQILAAKSD